MFEIADRHRLVDEFASLIRTETYISDYGGCCCSSPELENSENAADEIVKLIEKKIRGY